MSVCVFLDYELLADDVFPGLWLCLGGDLVGQRGRTTNCCSIYGLLVLMLR